MTEYVPVLWLGGGISREALEEVISAIQYHMELKCQGPDRPAWHIPPSVATELNNLVNAAHAELTKLPKPMSDLV